MAVSRAEKETELGQIEASLGATESAILVDFRGLNVPQVTELRRQIRAARGEYRVVKNSRARPGSPTAARIRSRWQRC
jgi:large subunit ribosomal protein L10